jgi:hypothetical protein
VSGETASDQSAEVSILVISYPQKLSEVFDRIVFRLCRGDCAPRRAFGFCDDSGALEEVVRRLSHGMMVDRLDILGHGAPGVVMLGDKELDPAAVNALAQKGLLNRNARIRLLGCQSGLGAEGKRFVRKLSAQPDLKRLGVTVHAPVRSVVPAQFGKCGFVDDGPTSHFVAARRGRLVTSPEPPVPPGEVPVGAMAMGWPDKLGLSPGYRSQGTTDVLPAAVGKPVEKAVNGATVTVMNGGRLIAVQEEGRTDHQLYGWSGGGAPAIPAALC